MFTHLDPNNHQREFQLGVHVVADNRYTGAFMACQCARNSPVTCRRVLCLVVLVHRTDSGMRCGH